MEEFKVGDLRWRVLLCRREQSPDPDSSGYIDTLTHQRSVKAAIRPVGTMTYLNGIQLGQEVTHKITIRWRSDIDLSDIIIRELLLPNGVKREETFSIRRWMDKDGRRSFLEIDAVVEQREILP